MKPTAEKQLPHEEHQEQISLMVFPDLEQPQPAKVATPDVEVAAAVTDIRAVELHTTGSDTERLPDTETLRHSVMAEPPPITYQAEATIPMPTVSPMEQSLVELPVEVPLAELISAVPSSMLEQVSNTPEVHDIAVESNTNDANVTEISNEDLDAAISRWMIEYNADEPLTIPQTINGEDLLAPAGTISEVVSDSAQENEHPALHADGVEVVEVDTADTIQTSIAPEVESAANRLVIQIETLEPEIAAEVHELLEDVLQEIEQLQMLAVRISDDNIPETDAIPALESLESSEAVVGGQSADNAETVETVAEAVAVIDTTPLEASLQRLFSTAGLEYSAEEIHSLALQLISSPGTPPMSVEGKDLPTAPADWGTRESLQWFTSQLRNQHHQTNLPHRLADAVGRYALFNLHELQPA